MLDIHKQQSIKSNWKIITIIFHAVVWGCYISYLRHFNEIYHFENPNKILFWNILYQMIFTYGNIFILIPKFFVPKREYLYLLALLIWAFAHWQVGLLVRTYTNSMPPIPISYYIYEPFFFINRLSFLIATAFPFYLQVLVDNNAKINSLNQQNQLKELAVQYNTHFLLNSFNGLHLLVIKKHLNLEEALLQLSETLKYILRTANQILVPVSVEKESLLVFVDFYVKTTEQEREIVLKLDDKCASRLIPAMLFIGLIKNAIKHSNGEGIISLDVSCSHADKLVIIVRNPNEQKAVKPFGMGMGVNLLKEYLQTLYQNDFEMTITQQDNTYETKISLSSID